MDKRQAMCKTIILYNTGKILTTYLGQLEKKYFLEYLLEKGIPNTEENVRKYISEATNYGSFFGHKILEGIDSEFYTFKKQLMIGENDEIDIDLSKKLIEDINLTKAEKIFSAISHVIYHNLNSCSIYALTINKKSIKQARDECYSSFLNSLQDYPEVIGHLMPYIYRP